MTGIPVARRLALRLTAIILGIGGAIIAVLVTDYLISRAFPQTGIPAQQVGNDCYAHHSTRHHGFLELCHGIAVWGKARYEIFTNSLGFIDGATRSVGKRADKPRLLFLGDSFTQGLNGSWADTFVGTIAQEATGVEVLNGGAWGYAPSQYLLVVEELLAKEIELDEVFVLIDLSDIQDEVIYEDGKDGAVHFRSDQFQPVVENGWRQRLQSLRVTSAALDLTDRLLVELGAYAAVTDRHLYRSVFDSESDAWTYRAVDEERFAWAGYAPLGITGALRKAVLKMTELKALLDARQIPLSVGVYPHPSQIVQADLDSKQVRLWHTWCDKHGCKRFVNLFPTFFRLAAECPAIRRGCWYGKYFIWGDNHFSRWGNSVIADFLMLELQTRPVVKSAKR